MENKTEEVWSKEEGMKGHENKMKESSNVERTSDGKLQLQRLWPNFQHIGSARRASPKDALIESLANFLREEPVERPMPM